jgi:hypothetical protein
MSLKSIALVSILNKCRVKSKGSSITKIKGLWQGRSWVWLHILRKGSPPGMLPIVNPGVTIILNLNIHISQSIKGWRLYFLTLAPQEWELMCKIHSLNKDIREHKVPFIYIRKFLSVVWPPKWNIFKIQAWTWFVPLMGPYFKNI